MRGETFPTDTAPIAFIDLEMTGLEATKHEIVEMAVIRVSQPELTVVEEWQTRVLPTHMETADPISLQISGWSAEAWSDALSLKQALTQFVEKTRGHILAGWNMCVDWAFLEVGLGSVGLNTEAHKRILDVMSFAYGRLVPPVSWNALGLDSVATHLGLTLAHHHRALADTRATFDIYKTLVLAERAASTESSIA